MSGLSTTFVLPKLHTYLTAASSCCDARLTSEALAKMEAVLAQHTARRDALIIDHARVAADVQRTSSILDVCLMTTDSYPPLSRLHHSSPPALSQRSFFRNRAEEGSGTTRTITAGSDDTRNPTQRLLRRG